MDIQKMQQEEAKQMNETELSRAVCCLLEEPNEQELYLVQALARALEILRDVPAYGCCGLGEEEMDTMAELMDYPFSAMKPAQAYRQLTQWDDVDPMQEEDLIGQLQDETYDEVEKSSALVRFVAQNLTGNRYDLSIEMP